MYLQPFCSAPACIASMARASDSLQPWQYVAMLRQHGGIFRTAYASKDHDFVVEQYKELFIEFAKATPRLTASKLAAAAREVYGAAPGDAQHFAFSLCNAYQSLARKKRRVTSGTRQSASVSAVLDQMQGSKEATVVTPAASSTESPSTEMPVIRDWDNLFPETAGCFDTPEKVMQIYQGSQVPSRNSCVCLHAFALRLHLGSNSMLP